jgi:hypothetical protein
MLTKGIGYLYESADDSICLINRRVEVATSVSLHNRHDWVKTEIYGNLVMRTKHIPCGYSRGLLHRVSHKSETINNTLSLRKIILKHLDRKMILKYPDRKVILKYADRKTILKYPDREIILKHPDRKMILKYADRKTILKYPDRKIILKSILEN